jgi:hypothetical protein
VVPKISVSNFESLPFMIGYCGLSAGNETPKNGEEKD